MERRGFLKRLVGALVAPAFIPAARLLLPPERPPIVVPQLVIANVDIEGGSYTLSSLDEMFKKLYLRKIMDDINGQSLILKAIPLEDRAPGFWHGLEGALVEVNPLSAFGYSPDFDEGDEA